MRGVRSARGRSYSFVVVPATFEPSEPKISAASACSVHRRQRRARLDDVSKHAFRERHHASACRAHPETLDVRFNSYY
jgi:hypothetical protein